MKSSQDLECCTCFTNCLSSLQSLLLLWFLFVIIIEDNRSCPLLRSVADVCCSSPSQTEMSGSILCLPTDDSCIMYSGQVQVTLAWDWRHVTTSHHTDRLLHRWFDDTINPDLKLPVLDQLCCGCTMQSTDLVDACSENSDLLRNHWWGNFALAGFLQDLVLHLILQSAWNLEKLYIALSSWLQRKAAQFQARFSSDQSLWLSWSCTCLVWMVLGPRA